MEEKLCPGRNVPADGLAKEAERAPAALERGGGPAQDGWESPGALAFPPTQPSGSLTFWVLVVLAKWCQ